MKKKWSQLNWYLTLICSASLAAAMIVAFAEVVARYLFSFSIIGVVEILTLALPFIIFMPLAYVEMQESHIRANMFVGHLPYKWQIFFDLFGLVLGLGLYSLFAWLSWEAALESWQTDEVFMGMLDLPVCWTQFAIAIGFSLAVVQVCIGIAGALRNLAK